MRAEGSGHFFKGRETTPQWAGISVALAEGMKGTPATIPVKHRSGNCLMDQVGQSQTKTSLSC